MVSLKYEHLLPGLVLFYSFMVVSVHYLRNGDWVVC